ncbi:nucleotide-binding domain containing protein [Arthrobacter sp. CJ23]|uniref:nucleotide-binding domain containing protein n=1 Tax=Arthrobacter sp. CJ23 TaxID=2972479 RepID=UPI0037BFED25
MSEEPRVRPASPDHPASSKPRPPRPIKEPDQPVHNSIVKSPIIAGSCSEMTNEQIEAFRQFRPCFRIDPVAIAKGDNVLADALVFAREHLPDGPVLIHSTASPHEVSEAQRHLGRARAAELTEDCLAAIAEGLVGLGCRQLIVAGGETSGAVVHRLGITTAHVGKEVSPGVPWLRTDTVPELAILLKSGNLGEPGLFLDAREHNR